MTDEVPCDGIAAVLPLPVSLPSIYVPTYPLGVARYVVLPYVWRRTSRTSGDTKAGGHEGKGECNSNTGGKQRP